MGGACGTYGKMRKTHGAIVNKADVKGLVVRSRRRWGDNSEIDLTVLTGLMSIRIEINLRLHKWRGVFLGLVEELLATVSLSRRSLLD